MAIAWRESNLRKYFSTGESRRENRLSLVVKTTYLLLHQLDLALTVMAVASGLEELNPWMRNLLALPFHLAIIKLFIPLLIAWLVPYKLLIPATLFLLVVVGWNIKELVLLW